MNSYFLQPFELTINKAKKENNYRIPIRIESSSPTVDKQKDLILLSAYTPSIISEFLKTGVIDYDHKSIIGKTNEEKSKALIGEPTDFKIEKSIKGDMEIPAIYADLYKENPIVKDSIIPALKAESTRWGASLGGSILKSKEIIKSNNEKYREISEIKLTHCAITPTLKAINQHTSIAMIKSEFDNFNSFMKAILAGSETDILDIMGGQALQKQSLEGGIVKKVFPSLLYIITQFKKAKLQNKIPNVDNLLFDAIDNLDYEIQKSIIEEINKNKEVIYSLV